MVIESPTTAAADAIFTDSYELWLVDSAASDYTTGNAAGNTDFQAGPNPFVS